MIMSQLKIVIEQQYNLEFKINRLLKDLSEKSSQVTKDDLLKMFETELADIRNKVSAIRNRLEK